ncbi:hypothetical protein XM38_017520 [Halomicronema hongdechloris C2206]|uniref:Uncharacterized protein n=1 Tax=Halomicronema hongdechloris C2206 TaxID=1641165 RepID=A0A1Z3HKJ4_9CYAN|nr:hypothetical protein [Halomicronema hongdechloris]ASC70805.1 hypothetical protein XM38_017520 [Halomicronema hongdechloris C2206]
MANNQVSASLSASDQAAVLSAIAQIKASMDFLIDLTIQDRKQLPKMGDKSRAFVGRALEVATQNPDFLPRSFDVEEMRRDVELTTAMEPVVLALKQLYELVDDTYMAVGSEAYAAALSVYTYAKASDKGAGLDTAMKDLGIRFAGQGRRRSIVEGQA